MEHFGLHPQQVLSDQLFFREIRMISLKRRLLMILGGTIVVTLVLYAGASTSEEIGLAICSILGMRVVESEIVLTSPLDIFLNNGEAALWGFVPFAGLFFILGSMYMTGLSIMFFMAMKGVSFNLWRAIYGLWGPLEILAYGIIVSEQLIFFKFLKSDRDLREEMKMFPLITLVVFTILYLAAILECKILMKI